MFLLAELLTKDKQAASKPSHKSKPSASKVQNNDEKGENNMKQYAAVKKQSKTISIEINDLVLAQQRKQNKISTPYDLFPFCVVH